jgi:hypothetical protein
VNHRIFERTLRPLVFHGACLFERHLYPQALLGVGCLFRCARELASNQLAAGSLVFERSTFCALRYTVASMKPIFYALDLGSGRDTR